MITCSVTQVQCLTRAIRITGGRVHLRHPVKTQLPSVPLKSSSMISTSKMLLNTARAYITTLVILLAVFLRLTSMRLSNALNAEVLATSTGKPLSILSTHWVRVNLCRSSLICSFFSLRECPRSLEVSAIWKKLWKISKTNAMASFPIPQDNETRYNNLNFASYSMSRNWELSWIQS